MPSNVLVPTTEPLAISGSSARERHDGEPRVATDTDHLLTAERIGLAVAIVVTLAHAVARLDATSLWLDEGYTLGATNDLWSSLSRTHGTMGLYYVVMWVWAWFGDATWWLRLPSTLFALSTLALLRPIARRVGGSSLVAVSLPVAALLPMFQAKAVEARSFALLTLVTCACWYALIRALDAPDPGAERRWLLLLTPLSVAGVFSHGLFIVHLAALGAVLLLGTSPVRRIRWFAPAAIAATVVTYVLHSLGASGIGTMVLGGPVAMVRTTVNAYFPDAALARLVLTQVFVVGLILTIRRVTRTRDRSERAVAAIPIAMAIAPCLVLALGSMVEPRYSPRYLAPIGLGIALVIGTTLVQADRAARRLIPRLPLAPVGLVSLVALAFALHGMLVSPHEHADDWRGAAKLMARDSRETDGIIFANRSADEPMLHRVPFEAAWREVDHGPNPTMVSPARPLGEVLRFDDPLTTVDAVRSAEKHPRIWVIEHQASGLDQSSVIVGELLASGFEIRAEHLLPNKISLVLLSQTR